MADDHNQQAYRASEGSSRGQGGGSGNDPLAELARLIGQSDPFGEYGRNNGNRNAAAAADQTAGWPPADTAAYADQQPTLPNQSAYQDQPYGAPSYGRQAFGSAPLSTDAAEHYPVDAHAPGYRTQGHDPSEYQPNGAVPGYEEAFPPSQDAHYDVHQQFGPADADHYYDDVQPNRRRISVAAIAGIFALAVLGTAGALGYRAVFGPSSAPTNPPVIKADNAPSKIVPSTPNQDAGKTITDRVGSGGNGQIEKLLSREEQPVPVTTTANAPASGNANQAAGAPANTPALGSGVVGDPKKIRTIAIRPDSANDAAPAAEVAPTPAAVSTAEPTPRPISVTPRPVATTSEPAQQAPRPLAAQHQAAPAPAPAAPAPRASNAPLSLSPNAVQAPSRPERVASTAPVAAAPPPAASSGGYAVQVSAQRSEADAQAAFRSLQGKFPSQLGNRAPLIKRVDLGDKGIYFRAMVGPFASSGEASQFCSGLKAAGGQCLIQRN
ncbi:MAG: SPOR domain-containing protein [Pseudolabrys sp.]|nr:SPOR domain-containing protein [Pseudolabrys sp.]